MHSRVRRLAKKDLAGIVYCKNCLALRAPESACFACFEFSRTDGALEDLGEHVGASRLSALYEEVDCLFETVLDVEKLRKTEELEDLVDFGLDFHQYEITASRFYRFEERCKTSDPGTRNVIEPAAVENKADVVGLDGLCDPLLEEVGVVGIDVAGEIEH